MSLATDATDTAKALVTASLMDDLPACKTLMPQRQDEAVHLMIALSKLSARMVKSLAEERGEDPLLMWQKAMLSVATEPC